jgi:hypothetical protein
MPSGNSSWLCSDWFQISSLNPRGSTRGDDHIVFEYDMSGTFDGSPFVCDGVDVIAVADGLVTRKDTYLDYIKLTEQIGEMPPIGIGTVV